MARLLVRIVTTALILYRVIASNTNYTAFIDKHLQSISSEGEAILGDEKENVGFWDKNARLLEGKTLKVVFRLTDVETQEIAGGTIQLQNGTTAFLDGSGVPVMWDLRDSLNLTFDISLSNDWTEAWEMVSDGDVDLGAPLRTVQLHLTTLGAFDKVCFMHPIASMSSYVYFRQPLTGSLGTVIFEPLKNEAWFVLSSCWLLCILVCCSIHYISDTSGEQLLVSDVVLWAVAVVNGRGYPIPKSKCANTPLRIAVLSAMSLAVVALAVYTAKIVSVFSVKENPIKSPEDLIKYGYSINSFSHVHIDRIFQNSKNKVEVMVTILDNVNDGEEAMWNLVMQPKSVNPYYAFLSHSDGFYIYGRFHNKFSKQLCDISSFSSRMRSARAMYLKKGSPFREVLNWKILQIVERGINHRHQKDHIRKYEYMCGTQGQSVQELTLEQTLFIFIILLGGAAIAVLMELLMAMLHLYRSLRQPCLWHKLERRSSSSEYSLPVGCY